MMVADLLSSWVRRAVSATAGVVIWRHFAEWALWGSAGASSTHVTTA